MHACDGYVVREMHRRCNYDLGVLETAMGHIQMELISRTTRQVREQQHDPKVSYYEGLYQRSHMVSLVILPYIDEFNLHGLSSEYLKKLSSTINQVTRYKPFEIVTVHDSFASHANNVNWVRHNYKEIIAEIADSNLLDDLLTQINGMPCKFNMSSIGLGDKIRGSSYALS